MFKHVVVAVDFSDSWPVLLQRIGLLRKLGLEQATLVHVLATRYPQSPQEQHRAYYQDLLDKEAAGLADKSGLTVNTCVAAGEPAQVLLEQVDKLNADLLLIGNRGHNMLDNLFLGSTAADAIRMTKKPVWLEPASGQMRSAMDVLLLATDCSDSAAPAQSAAIVLAKHYQQVLALSVNCKTGECEPALDDAVTAQLQAWSQGLEQVELVLKEGNPRKRIVEMAQTYQADLIVMGKRGHNRVSELLIGSTADAVCQKAERPVLIMP